MLTIPNNCRSSELSVFPRNWDKAGASIKSDWKIQFYFFDPLHKKQYPRGKYCQIKGGMNRLKSLQERREAVKIFLAEIKQLLEQGYNPITKNTIAPIETECSIEPTMPFIKALRKVREKMDVTPNCRRDLLSVIKFTEAAAIQLKINTIAICEIRRKHIKILMNQLAKTKKTWTANTYNYYRAHLSMLFKELLEFEAVELNPVKDLSKMKTVKKIRTVLSEEECIIIDDYTRLKHFRFNLLIHIFFHSGARTSEIFRVKGEHVNLQKQTVKYLILKGKQFIEVERPIKNIVLPLWKEAMEGCGPGDFVFGKGLRPAPIGIDPSQAGRRWKRHIKGKDKQGKDKIKEGLTITADWYSLKHLNTTKTVDALNDADAAKMNAHTSTAMVAQVYDINHDRRQNDRLKKLDHKFGA